MNEEQKVRRAIMLLSALYNLLCNCRRTFPELRQLLDHAAHLEDCPYRVKVVTLNITFDRGTEWGK